MSSNRQRFVLSHPTPTCSLQRESDSHRPVCGGGRRNIYVPVLSPQKKVPFLYREIIKHSFVAFSSFLPRFPSPFLPPLLLIFCVSLPLSLPLSLSMIGLRPKKQSEEMRKGWELIRHVRGEMTLSCRERDWGRGVCDHEWKCVWSVCVCVCARLCGTYLSLQKVGWEEGGSEAFSSGAL